MGLNVTILPVVTKDLPIIPWFTPCELDRGKGEEENAYNSIYRTIIFIFA